MNIAIFAIGGKWQSGPSGDCIVGTAHDTITFLSLLDLVEMKGGYMVSMHGTFGTNIISGEYNLNDARNLVHIFRKAS